MHTVYSDGGMTPAELASAAHAAGLSVVALTDHDNIDGIAEMDEACKSFGIVNVHGAEMSSYYGDEEVHILAYNPNLNSEGFKRVIKTNQEERKRRAVSMIEKFETIGYDVSFEEVEKYRTGSFSSSFVVRAVCAKYGIKDVGWAIRHFFHELKFHEPTKSFSAFEMVEAIHDAGATAVLAHPVRLKMSAAERAVFIRRLAACGLDGVEAFYKGGGKEKAKEFVYLARELGLKCTCGGDVHFEGMPFFAESLPALNDHTVDLTKVEF